MHAHDFRRLLGLLDRLDLEQRAQLKLHVLAGDATRAVHGIVEGRHVVRNGRADGLQRYRRRAFGHTFNALTDTPLARLGHREKWLAQAGTLEDGLSVRRAAGQMGRWARTAPPRFAGVTAS
jgi:hypothetical protein